MKIPIVTLSRIDIWYCGMYVARTCRACIISLLGVVLTDTKYMVYSTHTTLSRLIIHALQVLATYMPQYNKSILPRAKMGIFVCNNFVSPSEFECDPNTLIFSPIGHELSELC
jgi:hypothetical protein